MVPSGFTSVAIFVLLIAPGLRYQLYRAEHRADREDSTFVEISLVVLAGTLLSGATLLFLGLIRLIEPGLLADPRLLLTNSHYAPGHLVLISWTAFCFAVISLTLTSYVGVALPQDLPITVAPHSLWVDAFSLVPDALKKRGTNLKTIEVEVALSDGRRYRGELDKYSNAQKVDERELSLGGKIFVVDEKDNAIALQPNWARLIIPGSQITSVAARYVGSPASTPSQTVAIRSAWLANPARIVRLPIRLTKSFYLRRRDRALLAYSLGIEAAILLIAALVV
jgi:hypothetical protein